MPAPIKSESGSSSSRTRLNGAPTPSGPHSTFAELTRATSAVPTFGSITWREPAEPSMFAASQLFNGKPAPAQLRPNLFASPATFAQPSLLPSKRATPAISTFCIGLPQKVRKKAVTNNLRYSQDHGLDFGTRITNVRVGIKPNLVDFTVHENLLKTSPYFADVLGQTDIGTFIVLDNHKPAVFQIYVNWLYTGRLHSKPPKQDTPGVQHRKEWSQLIEVYILGNSLDDVGFQDQVMDALLDWFEEVDPAAQSAPLDTVEAIYSKLVEGSPLRELASDIVAWHFEHSIIEEMKTKCYPPHVPAAFLLDVLVKHSNRFQGGSGGNRLFRSPVVAGQLGCKYHSHGDKKCYKG